jgi:hypothetical protein
VVTGLLDNSKQDAVQIIGCQTLTRFIYSQVSSELALTFFCKYYQNMPNRTETAYIYTHTHFDN